MSSSRSPATAIDGVRIALLGLVVRCIVVVWAWGRIPPAADGTFYDTIARRIANGEGYTWRWPDGTITYAAHYPVGYPALVAFSYRVLGAVPGAAMLSGALLGALGVFAVHRLVARGGQRRHAAVAGLAMALHPGLVSYTPALMTEGVTASLMALALWTFARAREVDGAKRLWRAAVLGVVVAAATYVRPQCLVLAPLLTLLLPVDAVTKGFERVQRAAAPIVVATSLVFVLLAPWTARNCEKMGRCALVSVNGGWNLLIGTDETANGTWAEVKVPVACRTVFDEAQKDACFEREARKTIAEHPLSWLALVPKKLGATFDYAGAGPWYLHAANPEAFPYRAKVVLGAVSVAFERIVVAGALVAVFRALGRCGRAQRALGWVVAASAISLVTLHAYVAIVGLVAGLGGLLWRRAARSTLPPAFGGALVVVGSTLVIHAVFFGAGRYSLVTFPALVALSAFAFVTPDEETKAGCRSAFDSNANPRAS